MAKRKERPPKDARPKEKRHRHGGRKGRRRTSWSQGGKAPIPRRDNETKPPKQADSDNRE